MPLNSFLKTVTALALLAAASLWGGCASSTTQSNYEQAAVPHRPASSDVRFLEAVERSSSWSVHMADLTVEHCDIPEVREVAGQIKQRETANLAVLAKERARLGLAATAADHHDNTHMVADELKITESGSGDAAHFYVEHMIMERRDMIELARYARGDLSSPVLRSLAETIPTARWKDIRALIAARGYAITLPASARAGRGGVRK